MQENDAKQSSGVSQYPTLAAVDLGPNGVGSDITFATLMSVCADAVRAFGV